MRIVIRDNIIEVDGKPYVVTELYVKSKGRGSIIFSKSRGINGEFYLEGPVDLYYEEPGILILTSKLQMPINEKIEVFETRKSLVARTQSKKWEVSEVKVEFNDVISVTLALQPKRLIAEYASGGLEFIESIFVLHARVKSP